MFCSMSLTNPSQILLRNTELLVAQQPLFINLPEDGFIDSYLALNQQAQVSCYNTNYIDYVALKAKHQTKQPAINTLFASTYQSQLQHDLVVLHFPKSKAELAFTLASIAPYLAIDCKVLLVGEKKGGIQSAIKLSQHFLNNCQKVDAARHCLLFAGLVQAEQLTKKFNQDDWFKQYQLCVDGIKLTIASLPGVFSQQKLDIGTALLLKHLPQEMTGEILDFGCGAGVISCFIGKKHPASILSLLDVSALALASAEKTLSINAIQGTVFPSNSLNNVEGCYQYVVSNPPFHQGVSTHYQATEDFLSGIKQYMKNKGTINIVANSFLRYQSILQERVGRTETIAKEHGFSVYQSQVK